MAQFVPLTVHDLPAPYPEDEMDRAPITLLTPQGSITGDIVTSRHPNPKKFGMRVDWLETVTPDKVYHMRSHDFTKAQIVALKKTGKPEMPFEATINA